MTRIEVPKFEKEQALVDAENASRHTRLHPKGEMNELMRGQKADRDRKTEDRQARFFAKPDPEPEADDLAALRAQAQEAREQAASARRQAEAARARA
jgi:hypothetical protein